jgi:hypothetical protein
MSGCIWAYNRGGTKTIQTRQDGGIDTVVLLKIHVLWSVTGFTVSW